MDAKPPEFSGAITMIIGPLMAVVFSIIRTLYDASNPRPVRIALEAGVCAGITITAMSLVIVGTEYFTLGLSHDTIVYLSSGVGSFVGWIGANEIRKIVLSNLAILRKKDDQK